MANYSRFAPCQAAGPSWFPFVDQAFLLQSQTTGWGMVLEAATNDLIGEIWPVLCASFNPPNAMAVEVFDITDGMPELSALTTDSFYPGGDLLNSGGFGRGAYNFFTPTSTGLYQAISNVTQTPGQFQPDPNLPPWPVDDNSFVFGQGGNGFGYFFQPTGVTGTMNGRWVTRLRHVWTVQRFSNGDAKASVAIQSALSLNGVTYLGDSVTLSDEIAGGHTFTTDWYANPATGLPWTSFDVDKFQTGGAYGLGWNAQSTGVGSVTPLVFQSRLDIESAPTEQRLAIGVLPADTSQQGWKSVALHDPNSSPAPMPVQLVSGRRFLFLFRITRYQNGSGNGMAVCRLDEPGVILPGPPNWSSMVVPLNRQTHRLSALGPDESPVMGLGLQISGGSTFSLDTQFYAETAPTGLDTPNAWPVINAFFEISPVDINHQFYQEFTPVTTDGYGWFRINVCTATGRVDDDLRILIFEKIGGAHVAPIIRISLDDLESPTTQWQIVEFRLTDIPLTAGTQYVMAVYSATAHRFGWLVQIADAGLPTGEPGGPPLAAWTAGWGQQATPPDDLIVFNTLVSNPDPGTTWPGVAEITLSSVPDTPADFDAVAAGPVCKIEPVTIMWTNPTLDPDCGGFLASEIQRSDDAGVTFKQIAYITDENVLLANDYEWKPNPQYRMRTWRGDQVPSDFTDIIPVVVSREDCGLAFVSNQMPSINVWYPDVSVSGPADRKFDFPIDQQVFRPHNRDFQIVYTGLEDRGDTFSAMLKVRSGIVNTDLTPCVADPCADYTLQGVDVFDPLKAACRADVSYLAVINEHGNRWFANVNVKSGLWKATGEIFTAEIDVIEVTDTPAAFDAAAGS